MEAVFRAYVQCLNDRASEEETSKFLGSGGMQSNPLLSLPPGFEELENSNNLEITILHQLADASTGALAAILLMRVSPKANSSSWSSSTNSEAWTEFRRHVFCHFDGNTIASIDAIDDVDALCNREAQAVRPPSWSGTPPPAGFSLAETYRAYFDCVSTRTMGENLPKYTHDSIVFNGHSVTREQYRGAMEECHDVMADCKNTLERLVVDEEKQQLAARVVFEWTPIRKWAGIEPTGKRVKFTEHVFVWFDGGRMHTSVTLLDMAAFRQQMGV